MHVLHLSPQERAALAALSHEYARVLVASLEQLGGMDCYFLTEEQAKEFRDAANLVTGFPGVDDALAVKLGDVYWG